MSVNIIYMYYSDILLVHIIVETLLECFQRALFPFNTFSLHFFFIPRGLQIQHSDNN